MIGDRIDRAIRKLGKLGWVLQQGQKLSDLVAEYQKWHGLVEDGRIGPQTIASVLSRRFCSLPDRPTGAQAAGQLCKWLDHNVTWTWVGGGQLSLSEPDVVAGLERAWSYWADVCGVQPQQVHSAAQADVVIGAGIGRDAGPSGTLAWSELPCGATDRQLQMRFDTQDRFIIDPTGPSQGGIDFVRTAAHEIGHALGLPHQPAGNLMQPMWSSTIFKPQPYEVGLMSAANMYGPPLGRPGPGPGDDPGDSGGDQPADPADPPAQPDPPAIEMVWNGRRGRMVWE